MVTNKKSQNQITAAVFIFLTFFIYGISIGEISSKDEGLTVAKTKSFSRVPASVK